MSSSWKYQNLKKWIENGCPDEFKGIQPKKDIQSLYCSNNQLTSLPAEIGLLTNLRVLYCSSNELASLPAEIGSLTNLQNLYCNNNQLTSLPSEIGLLTNLQELHYYNNQLTSLPAEIGLLTNLQELVCSINQLTSLPAEIGLLTNLQKLNCRINQLTSLPAEIGNLTNLQELYCGNNQLASLPAEIGNLTNLQELDCRWNQLTSLPAEIGLLTNLQRLYCNDNQLISLPSEIGLLTNLQTLYCHDNRLISLPAEIGQLRNLTYINYSDNPIEYVPPNILRLVARQKQAQGIYSDAQSVHNSEIQRSLNESINRIISIQPTVKSLDEIISLVLVDRILDGETKSLLVEYSEDRNIHSILNLTFSDLLISVWNRILSSDHSTEIKKVLNTEMKDAECKCFTGRLSRLVNCLNGFDPLISVTISDNEQIGTIISLVKTQLEDKNEYTIKSHKGIAEERLRNLNYSEEIIKEWLEYVE